MIIALGAAIADEFNIEKLRYHKVIIATDADVDGAHIRTLLLTMFYRYFPKIIDGGYLYIAQPPLYRMQVGKEIRYVYNDDEKEKTISEFQKIKNKEKEILEESAAEEKEEIKGVSIQRYKGLGEMNPDQLWETTMDPEARVLKQVAIEDAIEADKVFDTLMGVEVAPRKNFIQTYAKEVRNLDI